MTHLPGHSLHDWIGADVIDLRDRPVGRLEEVIAERATGEPKWITVVPRGGRRTAIVPIAGAGTVSDQGSVKVSYHKAEIDSAPKVDASHHYLNSDDEILLTNHYGLHHH